MGWTCLRSCRPFSTYASRPPHTAFGPPPRIEQRRVVVTGLGAVSPIGVGVWNAWRKLLDGGTGVVSSEGMFSIDFPSKVAALIPKGDGPGCYKRPEGAFEWKKMGEFCEYSLVAGIEAVEDAGWTQPTESEKERTGVAIGAGMASLEDIAEVSDLLQHEKLRRVSPFFVPKILTNLAAGHLSIHYGFKGPNHSVSTACATGGHAIGDAFRMIKYGDADVMVCGGTDACVKDISVAGFSRAKALTAAYNDNPEQASRPFDRDRSGFVIAEGSGVMVLEEFEHAKRRGAKIYAEVRGYGKSGDAHHITAPSQDGSGAQRAMLAAIQESGLDLDDITYINAHATSTPLGDAVEKVAIRKVFGDRVRKMAVSSTKGATGHMLGAAGAIEAIFTVLTIDQNAVPPTINFSKVDDGEDPEEFNHVPNFVQSRKVPAAMTNSFGFGGTNASLVFSTLN